MSCFAGSRPTIEHRCRVVEMKSVPARNRTWSSTFAGSRANPPHSEDALCIKNSAGLFFGRRPSNLVQRALKTAILFITSAGLEGRRQDSHPHDPPFANCDRARPAPFCIEPRRQLNAAMPQQRCEESNPVGQVWNLPALPGAHRCVKLPTSTPRPAATRVTHSVLCSSSSR